MAHALIRNSGFCSNDTTSERVWRECSLWIIPSPSHFWSAVSVYFSSPCWHLLCIYLFSFAYQLLPSLVLKCHEGRDGSFSISVSQELKILPVNIQNYLFSEWREYSRDLEMQACYVCCDTALNLDNSVRRNVGKMFKDQRRLNITAFSD